MIYGGGWMWGGCRCGCGGCGVDVEVSFFFFFFFFVSCGMHKVRLGMLLLFALPDRLLTTQVQVSCYGEIN